MTKNNIKKIVFVNPPMRIENVYGELSEWGSVSPPTGLCYLAAFLRNKNYDVDIIDAEALHWDIDQTTKAVFEKKPQKMTDYRSVQKSAKPAKKPICILNEAARVH